MSILFKNNKEQSEYIKERLFKLYPNFKSGGYYFIDCLQQYINDESIILDAGCGNDGMLIKLKDTPKTIIGVDMNQKLLNENKIVNKKIISNLEQIPLENNSVNIVVSEFVLEHLVCPKKVFKEIERILKPDGVFIFITPNILNPIMFLSKILPYSVHKILRKIILKKQEETHYTYYRANTYKKLLKLLKLAGFKKCEIKRAGNPGYLGFSKPIVPLAIFFEKIIDNKILGIFKMYLVGCIIKNN